MSCPVSHSSARDSNADACPVAHGKLNPLTNIPIQTELKYGLDNKSLSQSRTASSIPRSTGYSASTDSATNSHTNAASEAHESFWMYPSPQMFYAALKRKGYETEAKDIDMMVAIHNGLNEEVWQQILDWERSKVSVCPHSTLKRFRGRPDDLSPMARWNMFIRGSDAPFDRHDWIVDRCGKDVRYIIDYYEGRPEPDGSPTMHVQVRPALDSWEAFLDRMRRRE